MLFGRKEKYRKSLNGLYEHSRSEKMNAVNPT